MSTALGRSLGGSAAHGGKTTVRFASVSRFFSRRLRRLPLFPCLVLQGPNFDVLHYKVLLRGQRLVVEGGTGVAGSAVQVGVQPQTEAPPAGQRQNRCG